jgi:hypothetical protein|nr:MAG TPA: hypothetical protein [Caudoviricetes sp.]
MVKNKERGDCVGKNNKGLPLIYGLRVDLDKNLEFQKINSIELDDGDKLVYAGFNCNFTCPSRFVFLKLKDTKSCKYEDYIINPTNITNINLLEPNYTIKLVKVVNKNNNIFFAFIVFKHDNGSKVIDSIIMDTNDAINNDTSKIKYIFGDYGTIALYEDDYDDVIKYIKTSFRYNVTIYTAGDAINFIRAAKLCKIDKVEPFKCAKILNKFALFNDGAFDYIIKDISIEDNMVDVIRVDGIIRTKMYLSDIKLGNFHISEDYRTVEFYRAVDNTGNTGITVAYDYENLADSTEKFIRDVYYLNRGTGNIKSNCADDIVCIYDKLGTVPLSDTNICRNTALIAYLCMNDILMRPEALELYAMYEHIEEKKYRDGR